MRIMVRMVETGHPDRVNAPVPRGEPRVLKYDTGYGQYGCPGKPL
jgi:hypothetical protein